MADTPSSRVLVGIATYNERENLPLLVERIWQFAPQADVLVIDDNSPDGTGQWCDEHAAHEPRLKCLHRAGKQGLGTAILAGMQYAIEQGYDLYVNMDADFSHDPQYLPAILQRMQSADGPPADLVIGSRYVPGGKTEGWPLKRQLMSKGVNLYTRLLLGLPAADCSGGYRCYRVARLKQLDASQVRSRGYSFQQEVLWLLCKQGCHVAETPITFADRIRGQSKITLGEAWGALRTISRLGWRARSGG